MDIFEQLENLNVSEECFDDIMGLIEELIDEAHMSPENIAKVAKRAEKRYNDANNKFLKTEKERNQAEENEAGAREKLREVNQKFHNAFNVAANHVDEKPGLPNVINTLKGIAKHVNVLKANKEVKKAAAKLSKASNNTHSAVDKNVQADKDKSKEYQHLIKTKYNIAGHYRKKYDGDPAKITLRKQAGE